MDINKFIEYITKDWEDEDWETTTYNELFYQVSEWIIENPSHSQDFFTAQFEFEQWVGW